MRYYVADLPSVIVALADQSNLASQKESPHHPRKSATLQHITTKTRLCALWGIMHSEHLRDTLLAMERQFLKDQIIHQLCSWERCRDDRDLLLALSAVHELVSTEDANQVLH